MAKSALSSFLIRKFQKHFPKLYVATLSGVQHIQPFCFTRCFQVTFCLSIIAAILAAKKKGLFSPSYPRVIPSISPRGVIANFPARNNRIQKEPTGNRTKQLYPKGNNRNPKKTKEEDSVMCIR